VKTFLKGNIMSCLYETCLSDCAWEVIEPLFPANAKRGRRRVYSFRSIVDAIFYVLKNGCVWRCLPNDFPPHGIVYHYFRTWSVSGLWAVLNCILVAIVRTCAGRDASPSLVSIDSQSQTAEPGVDERGLDGGKKINGRKRHIVVDTMGLMLLCICTAANVSDRVAGEELVTELNKREKFPRLAKILGDNAYKNLSSGLRVGVSTETAERLKGQKGFVPQIFRWAVERTFAWLNRNRRLVRNYEKNTKHQESMNYIANARLCIRRLENWLTT